MNIVDKMLWIRQVLGIEQNGLKNCELLVRTNIDMETENCIDGEDLQTKKWFVHYFMMDEDGGYLKSLLKIYTDDLDDALDDVIELMKNN